MWVRKTQEEVENTKNEKEYIAGIKITPFKGAVFIFIFVMILQIIGDLILGKSKGRFYLPVDYVRENVTLSDLPSMLPEYLVISSLLGIFFYLITRKLRNYKLHGNTYLCKKCYKVKSADKNYQCECGGEYIEIYKMKWVEDKMKK